MPLKVGPDCCESLCEGGLTAQRRCVGACAGMVFPMGSPARIVHIPEDEAVLLNSRDKAPFMICVEVFKYDDPR